MALNGLRWYSAPTQAWAFHNLEQAQWGHWVPPRASVYTVVIASRTKEQWLKERARALKARATQKDWQTPAGSTFTPRPLGGGAKVCLVYGDAMSPFPGDEARFRTALGQTEQSETDAVFGPIPDSPDSPQSMTQQQKNRSALVVSWLTTRLVWQLGLQPSAFMGFSMGELISRWCSQAALTRGNVLALVQGNVDNPMWQNDALCGEFQALRKEWNQPLLPTSDVWQARIVLNTPVEHVLDAVAQTDQSCVPLIATDKQCIVAGSRTGCESVLGLLGDALTAPCPLSLVAHCKEVPSLLPEAYAKTLDSILPATHASQWFAQMYTHTADFRTSVRSAFHDHGMKIFIEVGCGGQCTRNIDHILSAHRGSFLAIALNGSRRGDVVGAQRQQLAKLLTHGVLSADSRGSRQLFSPCPVFLPVRKVD
jgi:acyl transferase domain-containing protein